LRAMSAAEPDFVPLSADMAFDLSCNLSEVVTMPTAVSSLAIGPQPRTGYERLEPALNSQTLQCFELAAVRLLI
jgi:hypothetical protein